jgi:transglutaminase-like putative cysteine protease
VSEFEVETLRANPFDYVPEFGFDSLPANYPPGLAALLAPYRRQDGIEESVLAFAGNVAAQTSGTPIGFLDALNRAINERIEREIRDDDRTLPPGVTLGDRKGACRDLTVLFMAASRAMGLAARFVSGYRRGDLDRADRHLHSWPEVYIPGGGWRGWDPSEGIAVGDTHVALVAAASQTETLPVEGAFIGDNATSKLDFTLEIRRA